MPFLPIILFFLYTWGLGFTLGKLLKESDNFFERNAARIGMGLCLVPLIGLLLSVLRLPVDWRIFIVLSTAYPAYFLLRNYKHINPNNFKLKKSDISFLLVFLVFIISFYAYYTGSFSYPYLEDDDSWSHALGAKYVSVQKTFFNPGGKIHYLDPYPPFYDGAFGLLHQASPSVYWTLKFFNALIISLSILFFYIFMKEFSGNSVIAAFSAIVLAMIPAYLSHFIWAHAFIPGFIFLALYFMERIRYDKKWVYAASIAVCAIILTSITQTIKFVMIFLIYFALKNIADKKFHWEHILSGILGLSLSFLWWTPLAIRYGGLSALLKNLGLNQSRATISLSYFSNPLLYAAIIGLVILMIAVGGIVKNRLTLAQKEYINIFASAAILATYILVYSFIYEIGTADRIYDFNDFFIAQEQNMINNPIGIGIAALLLSFAAFFFVELEIYAAISRKKDSISRIQYNSLFFAIVASSVSLFISLLSFSFFRLNPSYLAQKWGMPFLKQWMLREPAKFDYVYSFSFKVWGVHLFIGSLIAIAAVYLILIRREYIEKQKFWVPIGLLWFAYAFAGIYDIPTQLFTFRLWMIMAVAVSIIAGYGFNSLSILLRRTWVPAIVIFVALIVLILYTSGMQKYAINTSPSWPPGGFWTSGDEISGYVWMRKNLAANTPVFTYVNNGAVIGTDMYTCHWCQDVRDFQNAGFNKTSDETYNFLKSRRYQYLIIDGQTAKKFGLNESMSKTNEFVSSGKFKLAVQNQGFILLKVS